jgi:predicted PurR-regulated permease PerM
MLLPGERARAVDRRLPGTSSLVGIALSTNLSARGRLETMSRPIHDRRPLIDGGLITGRRLLVAAGAIAAIWLGVQLKSVIVVSVVALVLVGTLNPLTGSLQRKGLGRTFAVSVIFVVMVGVVVTIGLITVPALIAQAQSLIQAAPGMQLHLAGLLERSHVLAPVAGAIRHANLQELLLPTSRQALSYSSDLLTAIGWALTTLALAFYILADPGSTQAALYGVVPRRFHVRLARIMLNLEIIVGGYMRGQILTSGLMGVVTYVLLRLLHINNPLPLAVFAGIADVLPYIGGILAAIPLVAAAIPHGTGSVAVLIAGVVLYQEVENRLILPRVYGRVLRLPAWAITLALLAGGELMGIVGALLALPVTAGVRMIAEELRIELPGARTIDPGIKQRDEQVEDLYSELAAGAGAGTSAGIALEIAGRATGRGER